MTQPSCSLIKAMWVTSAASIVASSGDAGFPYPSEGEKTRRGIEFQTFFSRTSRLRVKNLNPYGFAAGKPQRWNWSQSSRCRGA